MIQTEVGDIADVVEFVTRIHEAIRQPYQCLGHQLSTDASIGIALAPRDGTDLDQLIKNADLAMYGAKAGGRRTHRFFEPAMDASAKARLTMEQDLRQALVDGGFEIHYQPLVNLKRNEVTGCEALLRWRHPERGMISPAEFIPVAEDTGLINELGEWVLRTACAEATSWPDHIRLAVNVSPVQLKCQTMALKIASALAASGLAANRLELEITEAVLIHDDERRWQCCISSRDIGVRIALDDFGTGYSSLSYLKRFPFDKIKIDRCFVSDIAEIDGSSTIVQAVVNIAASAQHDDDGRRRRNRRRKRKCCANSAAPKCRAICSAPPSPAGGPEIIRQPRGGESGGGLATGDRQPPLGGCTENAAASFQKARYSGRIRNDPCKELGSRTFVRRTIDAASGSSDLRDRSEAACRDLEPGVRTFDRGQRLRSAGHHKHWQAFYEKRRYCLADLVALDRQEEVGELYPEHTKPDDHVLGLSAENWCVMPKLGTHLYLAIDAGPIHDEAGHLIAVVETLRDMTDQKRAELALKTLAAKDGLTGLGNRRAFDQTLETEWTRAQRAGKPLALLFVDVDHFKLFNDQHGHQNGDECLRAVAEIIGAHAPRPTDLAARYGGEEFAVILPDTGSEGARMVAERIVSP